MRAFWLELKSSCKSIKFLVLILVLLSYQVMLFVQFGAEGAAAQARLDRSSHLFDKEANGWVNYWQKRYNRHQTGNLVGRNYPLDVVEYNLAWHEFDRDLTRKINEAEAAGDWDAYHRHWAERRILEWDVLIALDIQRHPMHPKFLSPADFFGDRWEWVQANTQLPQFESPPLYINYRMQFVPTREHVVLSTDHHLRLLEAGLPPAQPYDTSPWAFLFNFLRRGLPKILGIIVLLITVTLLHQDKKYGSIKASLQRPKSRTRFLLRKTGLGFSASLIAIVLPLVIMFLITGINHGNFNGLSFPVLIHNNIASWSVTAEHARLVRWTRYFPSIGLSQYLPSYTGADAFHSLDFIPLWQFLALAAVTLTLFILFCTVVGILISILVKNELLAQIVAIGVFVLGSSFGRIFPALKGTVWDIFSNANAIAILEGNHCSTFLGSAVTLLAGTLLLFAIGTLVFRKQDIAAN